MMITDAAQEASVANDLKLYLFLAVIGLTILTILYLIQFLFRKLKAKIQKILKS